MPRSRQPLSLRLIERSLHSSFPAVRPAGLHTPRATHQHPHPATPGHPWTRHSRACRHGSDRIGAADAALRHGPSPAEGPRIRNNSCGRRLRLAGLAAARVGGGGGYDARTGVLLRGARWGVAERGAVGRRAAVQLGAPSSTPSAPGAGLAALTRGRGSKRRGTDSEMETKWRGQRNRAQTRGARAAVAPTGGRAAGKVGRQARGAGWAPSISASSVSLLAHRTHAGLTAPRRPHNDGCPRNSRASARLGTPSARFVPDAGVGVNKAAGDSSAQRARGRGGHPGRAARGHVGAVGARQHAAARRAKRVTRRETPPPRPPGG